jgi:hypothetical protein
MGTGEKYEPVTVQAKGKHKMSNVISTSKAVGVMPFFFFKDARSGNLLVDGNFPPANLRYNGSSLAASQMALS